MFQVSIRLDIEETAILLPRELHDFKSATLVYIPQFQMGINLHDHFMGRTFSYCHVNSCLITFWTDLTANSGLLRASNVEDCSGVEKIADVARARFHGLLVSGKQFGAASTRKWLSAVCLDFELCGNRLFGPPPQNATYFAVYEVNLGPLSGSASTSLVNSIAISVTTFTTGFKNALDSISEEYRLDFEPDVTFVKLGVKSADLTWSVPRAAIRLSIPNGIRYDSNDLGGKTYKHLKSVVVPSVKLRCLSRTASHAGLLDEWFEIASASFDINADIYGAPPNWKADAQRQKIFVQSQDMLTGRVSWVYDSSSSQVSGLSRHEHPLALLVFILIFRVSKRSFPSTACSRIAQCVSRCS